MTRGIVNDRREAVVELRLRGPEGAERVVEEVVDTGFTASLTLPPNDITALGLTRQSGGGAVLADGSIRQFDVYAAEMAWADSSRSVLMSGVGDEVLLGKRLLEGIELRIEVTPGGSVQISSLA